MSESDPLWRKSRIYLFTPKMESDRKAEIEALTKLGEQYKVHRDLAVAEEENDDLKDELTVCRAELGKWKDWGHRYFRTDSRAMIVKSLETFFEKPIKEDEDILEWLENIKRENQSSDESDEDYGKKRKKKDVPVARRQTKRRLSSNKK
jgi:hypothetical protein